MSLNEISKIEIMDLFTGDAYKNFKENPERWEGQTFYDFLIDNKFFDYDNFDWNLVAYDRSNNNLSEWLINSHKEMTDAFDALYNEYEADLKASDFVDDPYRVESFLINQTLINKFVDIFKEKFPNINTNDEITLEKMEEVHNYFATLKNQDADDIKLTM
ncbi:hypothetical protein DIE66_00545 [Mycoplasmopsis arginini]|uniref:hypothetical protein n=1 Tax=Mycoplasmopsis arginini TaxID=2094 RepID=UPI000D60B929|nr:hypothetical protein [Mycoplasmopsis arginini]PWC09113.1 hypothetical protein DIE66_00545 [Mycoplasmopsis arginini]